MEGSRLEGEFVQPEHVVLARAGDVDAGRDRAAQIDLRVHFDPRLGPAEVGPGKEAQREIDGRGVQRIDGVFQLQTQVFPGIEGSGFSHEPPGQILPQPPVPLFVGVGQGGLGDRLPKTQVIESLGFGVQTRRDIAQPPAPGDLGEAHADELPFGHELRAEWLAAAEMFDPRLRIVAFDQAGEGLAIHPIEDLGKNVAAGVHRSPPSRGPARNSNA